jgi:hypothetical protein
MPTKELREKRRVKMIPREKDIQCTIGVVIIWIVLTALALSWGFIH